MRKENIDHFFKYGTFPYGEWSEGSNKAAGKLPVATTLSLLDTVVHPRAPGQVAEHWYASFTPTRNAVEDRRICELR